MSSCSGGIDLIVPFCWCNRRIMAGWRWMFFATNAPFLGFVGVFYISSFPLSKSHSLFHESPWSLSFELIRLGSGEPFSVICISSMFCPRHSATAAAVVLCWHWVLASDKPGHGTRRLQGRQYLVWGPQSWGRERGWANKRQQVSIAGLIVCTEDILNGKTAEHQKCLKSLFYLSCQHSVTLLPPVKNSFSLDPVFGLFSGIWSDNNELFWDVSNLNNVKNPV